MWWFKVRMQALTKSVARRADWGCEGLCSVINEGGMSDMR